jgi:ParB family chromosome partitioning protein
MMRPMNTQIIEVEWHQLDLRYQMMRKHTRGMREHLMLSLHRYGLLVPIVLIASDPWIVIDGYLRISALKALGFDTVRASVSELPAAEALVAQYTNNTARPWDALEEARLLQELISSHHYSQAQVASRLGKSEAWVSHRLQLITQPEFITEAVYQGYLSVWTASRLMVPFARANEEHARQLIHYLMSKSHSSREIQAFYEHYLRSNKKVREHLLASPQLFFKSLQQSDHDFPEQRWEKKVTEIVQALAILDALVPGVFYREQSAQEQNALKAQLDQVATALNALQQSAHRRMYVPTPLDTRCATATSGWQKPSGNQSTLTDLAQHSTQPIAPN